MGQLPRMHVFKDCGRAGRGSSLEAAHAGKLEAQASEEAIARARKWHNLKANQAKRRRGHGQDRVSQSRICAASRPLVIDYLVGAISAVSGLALGREWRFRGLRRQVAGF